MPTRRCFSLATIVALLPIAARAQSVRGVVVDPGDHPVPGVVVLLVDSASQVVARALSNASGQFALAASRPGTYRLRTLRIGFRPVVSEATTLGAGTETTKRLVVTGLPLALDTMRVVDRNVCRAFTDSGAATYAVWDQVRTALIAAQLTSASRAIAATTVSYQRSLDPGPGRNTGRVLRQQQRVSTDYVTRAWLTLPPDSLRRVGYVVAERDNSVVYYAPGLDMLLSNGFVEDHCFKLTTDRHHKELIGIAFEPSPERGRRLAEIRGTLWLDRASSELRRLEFRYVNVSPEQEDQARGTLEFVRMRDGAWAISRWNIQMPIVAQEVIAPGQPPQPRVAELRADGGELALARRGADTLWATPPLTLAGRLLDSLSGSQIAGARVTLAGTELGALSDDRGRFAIPGVMPGQYSLDVRTPSLDSMNTVHRLPIEFINADTPLEVRVPSGRQLAAAMCGPAGDRSGQPGIVVGSARVRGDSTPIPHNLRVIAEWGAGPADTTRMRRLEVHGAADGRFRLCGVPVGAAVTLRASSDDAETADPLVIHIAPAVRLARTDLILDRLSVLAARGATFTGIVVADSTRQPVAGAEVALPDLAKSVQTDSRGVFIVRGIPAGEHQVLVRRMGYGAADTHVAFSGHETVERRVVLGRAVMLEGMTVSEKEIERTMLDFEENRRLGLGHFMTRAEISRYDGMKLPGVLEQLPGVGFVHGITGQEWVTSKRAPLALCFGDTTCLRSHGYYVPERFESLQGMKSACYALVYVDGIPVNGMTEPTEPFDVNSIQPEQIEAMEFYEGPAQTPVRYLRMGANCGVLVLWRRRSP